jgi:hypothetical protein
MPPKKIAGSLWIYRPIVPSWNMAQKYIAWSVKLAMGIKDRV